jgi:hypothetical protein
VLVKYDKVNSTLSFGRNSVTKNLTEVSCVSN